MSHYKDITKDNTLSSKMKVFVLLLTFLNPCSFSIVLEFKKKGTQKL